MKPLQGVIYERSKILKNHKTWAKYEKLKIENYDIKNCTYSDWKFFSDLSDWSYTM